MHKQEKGLHKIKKYFEYSCCYFLNAKKVPF